MARGLRSAPLIAALLLALPAGSVPREDPPGVLVRYSFDDDLVDTGPDTFSVYEHARGSVDLSDAYRFSGYHSVEIRDVAGDGDFPELQGHFPVRRDGRLYAHFALLVTDPEHALNVALAGPAGFRLGRDGIAFWLRTRNGALEHVSDSIPKRLLAPRPFTWYRVDLVYDLGRGRYDLAISVEDDPEPSVRLLDQPGAASQRESAVDKFSFIGDTGTDESEVLYYVDDVVIGTDAAVAEIPFEAPGRRRLFFERYLELRAGADAKPTCLPDARLGDFGIGRREAAALMRSSLAAAVRADLALSAPFGSATAGEAAAALDRETQERVLSLRLWAAGCRALAAGAADSAVDQLDAAARLGPGARRPAADRALALAALGRFDEADAGWRAVERQWRSDPLYPLVPARLGLARGAPAQAEWWLRDRARELVGSLSTLGATERGLVEQYFYALLWSDRANEAERFALVAIASLQDSGSPTRAWVERAGDAAVFAGDYSRALERYEQALEMEPDAARLLLKLADMRYLVGDEEAERALRERIYGSLLRRS